MPLHFSSAHSSRIVKRSQPKNPLLKRSSSSSFAELGRRKPVQRSHSKPEVTDEQDYFGDRLDNIGLVKSLAADLSLRDVPQMMRNIRSHMFDELPANGGFNSTRIAEILNFRRALPPTVTIAHVHALLPSPTTTEREIAELMKKGVVRRTIIPGRGAAGTEAGLALSQDVDILLRQTNRLDQITIGLYDHKVRQMYIH